MFCTAESILIQIFDEKRVLNAAEVQEKQRARKEYREAVAAGHGAFLLERDEELPDVFSISVGSLPPNSSVLIKVRLFYWLYPKDFSLGNSIIRGSELIAIYQISFIFQLSWFFLFNCSLYIAHVYCRSHTSANLKLMKMNKSVFGCPPRWLPGKLLLLSPCRHKYFP